MSGPNGQASARGALYFGLLTLGIITLAAILLAFGARGTNP